MEGHGARWALRYGARGGGADCNEWRLREISRRSYPTLSSASRLSVMGMQHDKGFDPEVRFRPSRWPGARSSHHSRRTV